MRSLCNHRCGSWAPRGSPGKAQSPDSHGDCVQRDTSRVYILGIMCLIALHSEQVAGAGCCVFSAHSLPGLVGVVGKSSPSPSCLVNDTPGNLAGHTLLSVPDLGPTHSSHTCRPQLQCTSYPVLSVRSALSQIFFHITETDSFNNRAF